MTMKIENKIEKWITSSEDDPPLILVIISFIARFYLVYICIKAGIANMNDQIKDSHTISSYGILTPELSYSLAVMLGPLYIACGLILLLELYIRKSASLPVTGILMCIIGIPHMI